MTVSIATAWNVPDAGEAIAASDIVQMVHTPSAKMAYTGTAADGNSPADNQAADMTTYAYASRFTTPTGVTTLDRIELKLIKAGTGADLSFRVYTETASAPGTLLITRTIPKQWVPTTAGGTVISVGMPLTGLVAVTNYWIVVMAAGDGSNNVKWRSLNATDASHPAKRSTDGGASWSAGLTEEMYVIPYYNGVNTELINLDEYNGSGQYLFSYTSTLLTKGRNKRDDLRWIETVTYSGTAIAAVALSTAEA